MSKTSYVEFTITGPNTERKIVVNAQRSEPHTKNGVNIPGEFNMYYQVNPEPPKDEKSAQRTPEEDLMHFVLIALMKGLHK